MLCLSFNSRDFPTFTAILSGVTLKRHSENTTRSCVRSGCDNDIELFVCLYFFPTCRETSENIPKVQPPCRDFCLRIRSPCGTEIANERQSLDCDLLPPFDPLDPTSCYDPYHLIVINEVKFASNPGFVEFWDFGMNHTILDSFQVVFFNHLGDVLASFSLNGRRTRSEYFTIGGPGPDSDIEFDDVGLAGAVALYRDNSNDPPTGRFSEDLVDALIYQVLSNSNAEIQRVFPNHPRLFNGSREASTSRCYSLRPLTVDAFDRRPFTFSSRNSCPQEEVQTESIQTLTKKCCFDTVLYCSFRKLDNTGYCVNRDYWMSGEALVKYNIYERAKPFCGLSAEMLAISQSFWESDHLTSDCDGTFAPKRNVHLIHQNLDKVQYISYSPLDEPQLINSSGCQNYTKETCLEALASHFANNTDTVRSEATCDASRNYIGYTTGLSCFGDASFPCLEQNSTWQALVTPITDNYKDLRFHVDVLSSNTIEFNCSKSSPCDIAQDSSVTFSTNNSVEIINFGEQNFTFIVSVIVNDSPFNFEQRGVDLFEVLLLFNAKQKITLRPPVIQLTPPTKYVVAQISPSAGLYTIIDRFD